MVDYLSGATGEKAKRRGLVRPLTANQEAALI